MPTKTSDPHARYKVTYDIRLPIICVSALPTSVFSAFQDSMALKQEMCLTYKQYEHNYVEAKVKHIKSNHGVGTI